MNSCLKLTYILITCCEKSSWLLRQQAWKEDIGGAGHPSAGDEALAKECANFNYRHGVLTLYHWWVSSFPFYAQLFLIKLHVPFFFPFPPVIRGLSADFWNSSSLRVSWDASSPEENVTGYDIIVFKENAAVSRVRAGNGTSSVTIPFLDQCNNYTVKVAANSSVGLGNYTSVAFFTRCGKMLFFVLLKIRQLQSGFFLPLKASNRRIVSLS